MKVTAAIFLVLAGLFSTISCPPVLTTLNLSEDPVYHPVSSEFRPVATLTIPILTMVTLPGLLENEINLPVLVPGSASGMCPSWQVYLSVVPIPNTNAAGYKLLSPLYVGSTLLVFITVILLAMLVMFAFLNCMWFVCSCLVSHFSEPISSSNHFTTAPKRYSSFVVNDDCIHRNFF